MKNQVKKSPQYAPRTKHEQMVRNSTLDQLYKNITIHTDFYKYTHPEQYPDTLEDIMFYGEARSGGMYPDVCNFGMQMIINEYFMHVPTKSQLALTRESVIDASGVDYFAKDVWEKVRKLGYFPMEICALPEGLVVPEGTPLFTIRPTEKFFTKSVGLLEPSFMHIWAPITIASRALQIKKNLTPFFKETDSMDTLPFAFNDFSTRSANDHHESVRKGAAHLLMFKGSDNVAGNEIGVMWHYSGPQVLSGVRATEHSVALSYGPGEGERRYVIDQLTRTKTDALGSLVIDTYDSKNFMYNVINDPIIIDLINQRANKTVFRPDSGESKEEVMMCFDALERLFGTHTKKQYRVLNSNVGTILANDVNESNCIEIYKHINKHGWASDNNVLGSGKGLMSENVDRDTEKFAIKANMGIYSDRGEVPLKKAPKGSTFKESKGGWIQVYEEDERIKNVTSMHPDYKRISASTKNLLQPIWRNGKFLIDERYENIVERTGQYLAR